MVHQPTVQLNRPIKNPLPGQSSLAMSVSTAGECLLWDSKMPAEKVIDRLTRLSANQNPTSVKELAKLKRLNQYLLPVPMEVSLYIASRATTQMAELSEYN